MLLVAGFRPSFRYYNKWLSLLGAVLCLGAMFLMNWIMALVTFVIIGIIIAYLLRRKPGTCPNGWPCCAAQTRIIQHLCRRQLGLVAPSALVSVGTVVDAAPAVHA